MFLKFYTSPKVIILRLGPIYTITLYYPLNGTKEDMEINGVNAF